MGDGPPLGLEASDQGADKTPRQPDFSFPTSPLLSYQTFLKQ